ncbi:MAG: aminotransferase class V-fold PLP-dependent enzyme [Desulfobulbaceae bacterium]|nr:aminotransferase class V-fold PLP-dependent enzyme [Desulfobulbaceae bacterium]
MYSPKAKKEKRGICGICSAGCWVRVKYDGQGRIAAVQADESSPYGMLCRAGEATPNVIYSPDRLVFPMRRKGPKGTFDFERISWDQAYDIIVENLQRIKEESGPEAAAVYTGSGSFELAHCDVFQPAGVAVSSASSVLFPFGSPNTLGVGALCYVSFAMIAPHVTMGRMFINTYSDIENAEMILIWGKNPAAHAPPTDFIRIQQAHSRGARIVVIDPRRTLLAKYPEAQWIPIRPGTDGALALGLCNILIEEELHDEQFARDWTVGFAEFSSYAQHFRPEVVEQITGIPAETVIDLARRIAGTRGVAPVMYSGLEYSDGAVQAIRATFVLWALAGQLDVPGGLCFTMAENHFPVNRAGHVANPAPQRAAGYNDFPVYTKYRGEFHAGILPRAVLEKKPYPIRLLLSLGASIITSWPQSDIWRKTLAGLDFFACIDRQLTADAAYADILLPAATYYEIESYMVYGAAFRIRERLAEPVGEARNDFFIMAGLAERLGYGHLYPQNEEELLAHVLKGSGFTPEEVRQAGGMVRKPGAMMQYKKWEKGLLRPDGQPGFDTPTGKFEIASTILEENGYDPLPVYTEPGESPVSRPDLAGQFPLVFNSGARANVDLHTLHHTVPELQQEKPVPTVMINTRDAADRGIANGDRVFLQTGRGRVEMYAYVTDDIMPGAVEASAMGGGALGPDEWKNANVNELTDLQRYDPISGFPVYKALLCEVSRADTGDAHKITGSGEYGRSRPAAAAAGMRRIYLDHNATTPVAPEVGSAISETLELFGNPSSLYAEGRTSHTCLENARRRLALLLNCTARRIVFTGGGSEANNLALKGIAFSAGSRRHLIAAAIEHPSVLNTCRWLEQHGFEVTLLTPDREGIVQPETLAQAMRDDTLLVTIMTANNETGVIQPVRELAAIAHAGGSLFHTDAVQAVGKIPLDVQASNVDLLSFSGHKFHAPKGVGGLYVKKGIVLDALVHGGSQEHSLRAGTENLIGIAGIGRAAELALENLPAVARLADLRDRLEEKLCEFVPGAWRNGHQARRLPNTLNITLPGIRGESLVLALDQYGIACSSGSACRSGSPEPSHALTAMGLSPEDAHCALRLSLGYENTAEEIDRVVDCVGEIVSNRKSAIRFVSCR